MTRAAIPTWYYALVVVRRGRRFAIVQEVQGAREWSLPTGRMEPGETMVQGVLRETREEAGIEVALEGVIRVEHSVRERGDARVRAIFVARPVDDAPLKTHADEHSLAARWVTREELAALEMRSPEVASLFAYLERGGPVYPLSILADERSPLRA